MEIHKALKEIEETLDKVDPIILYQSWVGRELQDILRRLRAEKHEQTQTIIKKL